MFYLMVGVLVLLAAAFACWPMLRPKVNKARPEHDQAVREVYRARVQELEGETEDNQLRQEIETELGAVLLTETNLEKPQTDSAC